MSLFKKAKNNNIGRFAENAPDFLCIGAQKAGTSWLYSVLEENPSVFLGPCKEIHFFDEMFVDKVKNWAKSSRQSLLRQGLFYQFKNADNPQKLDMKYISYYSRLFLSEKKDIEWYKDYFSYPSSEIKAKGEITPEYSMLPVEGINYILNKINKNIKIIYIIRDPVTRAKSQLRMNLSRANIRGRELTYQLLIEKMEEVINEMRADYKTYVQRWDSNIQNDNLLYLPYQLIKKPWVFIKTVEQFLNIPHYPNYTKLSTVIHKTEKIRLPNDTDDYFSEKFREQYQFLQQRFDKEFNLMI